MKKRPYVNVKVWVPILIFGTAVISYLALFPIYQAGTFTTWETKLLIINSCFFFLFFALIYLVFLYFFRPSGIAEDFSSVKEEKNLASSLNEPYASRHEARPEAPYVAEGRDFVTAHLIKALHLLRSERREIRASAIEYLVEAVEHQDRRAAVLLALLYERGTVVERDYEKALEIYNIAIELGSKNAYLLKAKMFEGREEKVSLYNAQMAAKGGVPEGLNYLGNKYFTSDQKRAETFYDLAIDRGSEAALYNNALLAFRNGRLRRMEKYWSQYRHSLKD